MGVMAALTNSNTLAMCVLALAIGALSFWIALNVIDYGFWGVLHTVFP
jgi:hypothetical protein